MKYVPNVLSCTRIILALSLLFIPALTPLFLTIYTIAGITDMVDGPLARKYNVASPLGANLDGIADYTFVAIALFRIVPALDFYPLVIISVVATLIVMKGIGLIVGYIRYRQIMMMHTYASKTAAMVAFLLPLIIHFTGFDENIIVAFFGLYVFLFLAEEILINLVLPEPTRDISSFRHAWRVRNEMKRKSE